MKYEAALFARLRTLIRLGRRISGRDMAGICWNTSVLASEGSMPILHPYSNYWRVEMKISSVTATQNGAFCGAAILSIFQLFLSSIHPPGYQTVSSLSRL